MARSTSTASWTARGRPKSISDVHRRARRAAVMDHVIDEDDDLAVDLGHARGRAMSRLAQVAVVPVLADVQGADRDRRPFELHQRRPGGRRCDRLRHDADEDDILSASISLTISCAMRDSDRRIWSASITVA